MQVAIVTGASSGIGLEIARGLVEKGYHTVLAVRNGARGAAAVKAIGGGEVMPLDVADMDSVRAFAAAFLARRHDLHLLVNNAGIHTAQAARSPQGFELTMATNHLGHFLLTKLLLDALKRGATPGAAEEPDAPSGAWRTSRIVNVASEAHRFARGATTLEHKPGIAAYSHSKLANIMFTYALARRLESTGVTVNAVHPGSVRSGWARGTDSGAFRFAAALAAPFLASPAQGARTPLHVATAPELARVSGRYFVRRKERASSPASRDVDAQERLWHESAAAVGLAASGAPV